MNFRIRMFVKSAVIVAYFQPSVGLIIPETSLSLNSKRDDKKEIAELDVNKIVGRIH